MQAIPSTGDGFFVSYTAQHSTISHSAWTQVFFNVNFEAIECNEWKGEYKWNGVEENEVSF